MGTRWTAQFLAADAAAETLAAALQAAVDLVDRQMSTWKPDSDLSRFNAAAVGEWVDVPADLAFVVEKAISVTRASSGAFDITVGQQVNAWGFGPPGLTDARDTETPAAGSACLDVRPDPPALRKSAPLSIDLSGIAKGYGVDKMAEALEREGVGHYLVGLDGELRCRGRKQGMPWAIGLDAPIAGEKSMWDVLELSDGAIATSGDYRHFRDVGGKRVSHTIDPATGRPLDNGIASVSVCDPACWRADAMATALMVLGPERGVAIAQARNIPALFLLRTGDGIAEVETGGFDGLCARGAY
jgi:thiamine biosynthesis lipoprotein